MKKYLITGGLGFIGKNLLRALIDSGNQVRILDNESRGSLENLKAIRKQFEFIKGDVRNPAVVRQSCKNVDRVIHLSSINGTKFFYSMPETVLDVATRGMINVINGCLWHGVEELFIASSSEVYQTPPKFPTPENVPLVIPDPLNPRYSYSGGKIISELLTINYGRKYFKRAIIFRPHNVYGPEMGWEHVIPQFTMRMRDQVKSNQNLIRFKIQGSGNETRAFMFIDDFIDGLMLVIENGKHMEIYNIGSKEEIKIKKVAKEIGKFFNRKVIVVPGKLAKGGTLRRLPNISKIEKLGFTQKVSLEEGIKITAGWYNKNANQKPPDLFI